MEHEDLNDEISDEEYEQEIDDDEYEEDEDYGMLNEGIDDSAKNLKNKNDDDIEILNDDIVNETVKIKRKKEKFVSNLQKISFYEYPRLISHLAENIINSKLFVPKQYETLLECESGDAIKIAMNWIKHRKIVEIPTSILRNSFGMIAEEIDPNNLVTIRELGFKDLDATNDDYFDTCFRPEGYKQE